jgi:PAS domain S-box-containing protein
LVPIDSSSSTSILRLKRLPACGPPLQWLLDRRDRARRVAVLSLQNCQQCVTTAAPVEDECEFSLAGEVAPIAARLKPRCDAAGRVTRLIGELRDVGNTEPFRALVENSPDFIARHSIEGRCLYMNPAVERGTGATFEQVRGKSFFEIATLSESATLFHATVMEVVRRRVPHEAEIRFDEFYGGQPVWHQVQFVPEFDPMDNCRRLRWAGMSPRKTCRRIGAAHARTFAPYRKSA